MQSLSVDGLKSLFTYDPKTGSLTWAVQLSQKAPIGKTCCSIQKSGRNREREYFKVGIRKRYYLVHRICFAIHNGRWPDGEIDHINGDSKDNRAENLREVTRSENQKNQKLNRKNKSGKSGVQLDRGKYWVANISSNGKTFFLGSFKNKEQAISARLKAEAALGYHENHGRR